MDDLYRSILDHHNLLHVGAPGQIIHLGDYIDRGTHGIEVIDRLMHGLPSVSTICLLGNHEAMMLKCLETDDWKVWSSWLYNGGGETLRNLGLSSRPGGCDPVELQKALGNERIAWLRALPLYHVAGRYLFVHAGIVPGIPIDRQNPKDLLWIRSRFLESGADHGHIVVHGHTASDGPVVRPNRICVDTGAASNGDLTAAVLTGTAPPLFLRAVGDHGKSGN